MKVEIWSDVVCPFCYIGKRKFETALTDFDNKDKVKIEWKSFQLDPAMKAIPGKTVHQYLAERKGVSVEKGKEMNDYMTAAAKEVGLEYHFDKAIINNTLDAHRLLHFAKKKGVQNETKEKLFAAYYTHGRDIGAAETLIEVGESVGLNAAEISAMLQSDAYNNEVSQDQYIAQQIGVQGVPFFVFNNKYAVSGAQPVEVFAEVLAKVWQEEHPLINAAPAAGFCTSDGVCS
ncbi:MAG: disulfide bond formation protein DsbA [Ferruginibacter sp.]|uniref:DsbA family oxidoreductase n=1 Tax=Ferruginibacter sp. TaxID=1940288 RepID=UPI00265882E8|nr:DsbA family oxidoreductase [Ferruginibacter sp.]MDB5278529.1 disulfide bond formation protein DsbA [Ferruginibacter sp.]